MRYPLSRRRRAMLAPMRPTPTKPTCVMCILPCRCRSCDGQLLENRQGWRPGKVCKDGSSVTRIGAMTKDACLSVYRSFFIHIDKSFALGYLFSRHFFRDIVSGIARTGVAAVGWKADPMVGSDQ